MTSSCLPSFRFLSSSCFGQDCALYHKIATAMRIQRVTLSIKEVTMKIKSRERCSARHLGTIALSSSPDLLLIDAGIWQTINSVSSWSAISFSAPLGLSGGPLGSFDDVFSEKWNTRSFFCGKPPRICSAQSSHLAFVLKSKSNRWRKGLEGLSQKGAVSKRRKQKMAQSY